MIKLPKQKYCTITRERQTLNGKYDWLCPSGSKFRVHCFDCKKMFDPETLVKQETELQK